MTPDQPLPEPRSRRLLVFWAVALGVLVIVGVLTVFALQAGREARREAESSTCVTNMCCIIYAAHMYAEDNDGVMPSSLEELRPTYVDIAKAFICPADRSRRPAAYRSALTPDTCSYELVAPGVRTSAHGDTVFLRCKVHGHVGYLDATVFDGKHRRTKHRIVE